VVVNQLRENGEELSNVARIENMMWNVFIWEGISGNITYHTSPTRYNRWDKERPKTNNTSKWIIRV